MSTFLQQNKTRDSLFLSILILEEMDNYFRHISFAYVQVLVSINPQK